MAMMRLEDMDNFKGKCLIAMPTLEDDVFAASVIYITEHNAASGAVGVIINKNLADKKKKLSTNFDFSKYDNQWGNIPFYFGGPVELNSGFILHQTLNQSGLSLTGERERIHQLATEDTLKPWLLTAGYCVWESFQLEREVRFNSWLVIDGSAEHLLTDVLPEARYNAALKIAGIANLARFDFNGAGNA